MSYTVGLDFGTHQTKICIEDASNPAQKVYEFLEFKDIKNNSTVLLPSIVQINQDDTVSYGFVDEIQCKVTKNSSPKPVLVLPDEPVLELPDCPITAPHPPKPQKPESKGHSIKDQLLLHKKHEEDIQNWKKKCRDIDIANKRIIQDWEDDCQGIRNDYHYDCDEYQKSIDILNREFEKELNLWGSKSKPQKQLFRYFKLATFTIQSWSFDIKPEVISCWYLTYILFNIEEKIGKNFFTQMGVPYSIMPIESAKQKRIAFQLLITANKLIEHYGTLNNFIKAKYHELIEKTCFTEVDESLINYYGLNVLPEAFAGLSSITQQGKLSRGMHLLADIGGGTTDIAFFTITDERLPDVHAVLSIPKGLNYIFEEYMGKNNVSSIESVQNSFTASRNGFDSSIKNYHYELTSKAGQIIKNVESEFCQRQYHHRLTISRLRNALNNQPVVYCGGGSMYDSMRIPLHSFSDVRLINKPLLNIPYVKNTNINDSIFPILATSYGLSIPSESEMKMTRIEDVFAKLPEKDTNEESRWSNDYNLLDD